MFPFISLIRIFKLDFKTLLCVNVRIFERRTYSIKMLHSQCFYYSYIMRTPTNYEERKKAKRNQYKINRQCHWEWKLYCCLLSSFSFSVPCHPNGSMDTEFVRANTVIKINLQPQRQLSEKNISVRCQIRAKKYRASCTRHACMCGVCFGEYIAQRAVCRLTRHRKKHGSEKNGCIHKTPKRNEMKRNTRKKLSIHHWRQQNAT